MDFPQKEISKVLSTLKQQSVYYSKILSSIDKTILENLNYESYTQLPILTRDDFLLNSSLFKLSSVKVSRLHFSGGTLGKQKEIYYSSEDWNRSVNNTTECLKLAGITDKDIVSVIQPFGPWSIGSIFMESIASIGALALPVGIHMDDKEILNLTDCKKATVIMAAPGNLCRLTSELSSNRSKVSHIKKIILSGEVILPGQIKFLKEVWDAEVISLYGSAETDSLGIEKSEGTGIHLLSNDFFFEILTNSGPKLPAPELEGELIVTTLNNISTPLIRYKVGDYVKCIDNKDGKPIIQIQGRSGGGVSFKDSTKVYPEQFHDAIKEVLQYYVGCQISFLDNNNSDQLKCTIFTHEKISDKKISLLRNNILRSSIDIYDVYTSGILSDIEIEIQSPNNMPLNQRGKVVWFEDNRTLV